jgi:DNA-binding SARP family transcriptional activator
MIEYSLWLAMWAWLQIALQKKVRGGVVRIFEEAGQIIHPRNKYDSVWVTMLDDLPYSPAAVLRKEYHEFSLRLNFRELKETKRISFKHTSNLLEHLRVMKDSPERYSIVVYIFHNRPILYALFNG